MKRRKETIVQQVAVLHGEDGESGLPTSTAGDQAVEWLRNVTVGRRGLYSRMSNRASTPQPER